MLADSFINNFTELFAFSLQGPNKIRRKATEETKRRQSHGCTKQRNLNSMKKNAAPGKMLTHAKQNMYERKG